MKALIGIFLSTLAMFVAGAVYWTNSFPYQSTEKAPDEIEAGKALLQHFPQSGVYLLPFPMQDAERLESLHKSGPIAQLHLHRESLPMMDPKTFIYGFLHEFVCILLVALLLKAALPNLTTYGGRFGFVLLIGLIGSLFANGGNVIWWHHSFAFNLKIFIYDAIAWSLVGLILAGFIKPKITPAPDSAATAHADAGAAAA
ncbi:MAG: hypothetical protein AB1813_05565 [Verrucomicrobiota bacterium]